MRLVLFAVLSVCTSCYFFEVEGEFEFVLEDHDTYSEEYGLLINPSTLEPTRLDRVSCESFAEEINSGDILRMLIEAEPVQSQPEFRIAAVSVTTKKEFSRGRRLGPQRLLIVLMSYQDAAAVFGGCGEDCIRDFTWRAKFNVDTLYRQATFGRVSFPETQGSVVSVRIPMKVSQHKLNGKHDLGRIRADAMSAVWQQHRMNVDDFDFVALYTPALDGPGVAFVGGKFSFLNSNFPDTLAHEIGHNFGNLHAGLDLNNDLEVTEEYGDRSSIMGLSHETLRGFSMPQQLHTSWVPSDKVANVVGQCDKQSFVLHSSHHLGLPNSLLAITLARDPVRTYVLSYRTRNGHDSLLRREFVDQVSLHYLSPSGHSSLVATIAPGTSYTETHNQYLIHVAPHDETSVLVTLCPNAARAIPVHQPHQQPEHRAFAANQQQQHQQQQAVLRGNSSKVEAAVLGGLLVCGCVVVAAVVVSRRRKSSNELKAPLVSLASPGMVLSDAYTAAPQRS